MGLFDDVVGAFLKGDAGKYQAILSWVEEQGGIQVLLEKLQSGGLGAILSTWLSNQQSNQSVSGEQVESALGTNAVSDPQEMEALFPYAKQATPPSSTSATIRRRRTSWRLLSGRTSTS